MIVTCQQCETRFKLDESRLPARGARVRCSKCKLVFHVDPPGSASEALEDVALEAARTGSAVPEAAGDLPATDRAARAGGPSAAAEPAPEDRPAKAGATAPDDESWEFSDEPPAAPTDPAQGVEGLEGSQDADAFAKTQAPGAFAEPQSPDAFAETHVSDAFAQTQGPDAFALAEAPGVPGDAGSGDAAASAGGLVAETEDPFAETHPPVHAATPAEPAQDGAVADPGPDGPSIDLAAPEPAAGGLAGHDDLFADAGPLDEDSEATAVEPLDAPSEGLDAGFDSLDSTAPVATAGATAAAPTAGSVEALAAAPTDAAGTVDAQPAIGDSAASASERSESDEVEASIASPGRTKRSPVRSRRFSPARVLEMGAHALAAVLVLAGLAGAFRSGSTEPVVPPPRSLAVGAFEASAVEASLLENMHGTIVVVAGTLAAPGVGAATAADGLSVALLDASGAVLARGWAGPALGEAQLRELAPERLVRAQELGAAELAMAAGHTGGEDFHAVFASVPTGLVDFALQSRALPRDRAAEGKVEDPVAGNSAPVAGDSGVGEGTTALSSP